MKSSSIWYHQPRWLKKAASLITVFTFVMSSASGIFIFPQTAVAASSTILSENFGTDASVNNIPGWDETGNDNDSDTLAQAAGSGNDSASPDGGRFAKIAEDDWICKEIDAEGFTNLMLSYHWRGDSDSEADDDGIVEYRDGGGSCDGGSWTQLQNHDVTQHSSWTTQTAFALPTNLGDGKFRLRFRNVASANDEFFRVDGVLVTGDALTPSVNGNPETQCQAFGYDFGIAKFEWDDGEWEVENDSPFPLAGYTISVTGDDQEADWTSNPAVAGVLAKSSTYMEELLGGANGTVTGFVPSNDGYKDLSHITFCGNYGSISVTKNVISDDEGDLVASDFVLKITDGEDDVASGTGSAEADELLPGTYYITEVEEEGYTQTGISCTTDNGQTEVSVGEGGAVTLASGQNISCVITNDDNAPQLATLNVCKIIVDEGGDIVTGVDAGATFSINLSGPGEFEQESVFTTPLTLTDDLLGDNGELDDAQCYTYQVAPGQYLYDEEEIDGGEGSWGPTYHDFFSEVPQSIDDFSVLTEDGSENDNDDADGVINIAAGQERTLAIINTFLGGQGGDPDQCEVTEVIVSDTLTLNEDESPSVVLGFIHSAWNTVATALGASKWIWSAEPMPEGYVADVTKTFTRSFTIDGAPLSGTLKIAADNGYAVTLNGDPLCADAGEFNYSSVDTCVIDAADLEQGLNIIEFTVTNKAQSGGTLQSNPAGLIYELSITEDTCAEPEEPLCVNEPEGGWADAVVESDQGLKKGGAAVAANRSVTSDVLGEADWTIGGSTGFFSLGFGGTITVSFDSFVPNVEGNDISIHEATNGAYPQESALIEVSQDGSTWYAVGTSASNGAVTYFDFDSTGLAWIKYVRITDTTNPALHNNDADGFDLDAVDATQTVCDEPIVAQCVPGQELLANGDFETPTVTNSAKWDIFPSGTPGLGWVVEWFGGALTYNTQNRPEVANLELQKHSLNGWNAVGLAGQWAEIDSDWVGPSGSLNGEPGSIAISQQVLTEIGETYTLSFDFSPRPNTASGQNKVEVLVNNAVIGTVGPTAGVSNTAWTSHEFSFVADSILSTVTLRDAGAPNDSLGAFVDNASLMCTPPEEPKFASVTLCKVNEEAQGLPGWTLLLEQGDAVDSFAVPSTSSAGTDSVPLTAGTPYVALASGVWLNDREPDNHVDAEYSTEDGWTTHVDGFTGYQDDILELQIAQTSGAWGAYNSLHSYAQAFTPSVTGPVNFRIFDGTGTTPNEGWYGDNSGSLNVVVTQGYAGITGNNGCVTFTGVPYGTYDISEMLQDGWVADSENPTVAVVDSPEETFTFVNAPVVIPEETATLHATKIVCEAEEYLPNWGNGIDGPASIDATTATAWLAEGDNSEHCWLAPDWEFQWATNADSSSNPGDNSGEAPSPWTTFGLTNESGVVTTQIPANDQVWVREVLQDGYVPFSGQNTYLHNSAELYCTSDVLNYDNWDFISPVVTDATYYCVAFNAELPPVCAEDETLVNNICVPKDNEGETYSDLEVTKTVDETNVEVGDFVTYTITVTNDGQEAGNVVVTENLPAGLSYVSHSASNGDETFNPNTGVWTIPVLVSGPAVLTLVVQVENGTEGEELENSVTVTSNSIEENTENNEDSVLIFVDDDDEDEGGGGSGPEIQSFFGANGPISGLGGGPLGQVLGASTEGQVLGESCGLYLDKFIRFNRNNDAEQVRKLQEFLNKIFGLSLPLTGFYGPLTYEAVLQFQTQYAETILAPWGLTSPTGIVYLTTLRQINMLECPVLSLELPPLTPWTN